MSKETETESIEFINQKSVERVGVLVNQLRECFQSAPKAHTKCKADDVLEEIENNPAFALKESESIKYPMVGEEEPQFSNPLKQLEPYSFYFP